MNARLGIRFSCSKSLFLLFFFVLFFSRIINCLANVLPLPHFCLRLQNNAVESLIWTLRLYPSLVGPQWMQQILSWSLHVRQLFPCSEFFTQPYLLLSLTQSVFQWLSNFTTSSVALAYVVFCASNFVFSNLLLRTFIGIRFCFTIRRTCFRLELL